MAKTLTLDNALSDDRKPVKINGESTGLLIGGKDVHIEGESIVGGDVTIVGDMSVKKDTTIIGDTTIGGDLAVTGASTLTGNTEIGGELTVTGDKIITDDGMHLDSAGNIDLDSHTGYFKASKAGTEFSAANSAYAGMILGYTRIQNDGTVSGESFIVVNSSAMTVLQTVHGTDLSINFKAPPSGSVEIQCSFWMGATSDGAKFSLSTGTSYAELDEKHTYDADQNIYIDETDHNYNTISFSVTGLTAGTDTTYYLAGLASGAGVNMAHGRNRASGSHYPPIILRAIALPATITTGE